MVLSGVEWLRGVESVFNATFVNGSELVNRFDKAKVLPFNKH